MDRKKRHEETPMKVMEDQHHYQVPSTKIVETRESVIEQRMSEPEYTRGI